MYIVLMKIILYIIIILYLFYEIYKYENNLSSNIKLLNIYLSPFAYL